MTIKVIAPAKTGSRDSSICPYLIECPPDITHRQPKR
jgi:hypothetical protein